MMSIDWLIPYAAGFLSLVAMKAIAEPVATLTGRWLLGKVYNGIYGLLPDIWDAFDLEWLPNAYTQAIAPQQWLEEIIPAKAEAKGLSIPTPVVKAIAGYVLHEFDLQKHLEKVRHAGL